MKRGAATRAIVSARLRRESAFLILALVFALLLVWMQPRRDFRAAFEGSLLLGMLIAVTAALRQLGRRLREIEVCERSAPLYGRELARAVALVPCAIVTAVAAVYWIASGIDSPVQAALAVLTIAAANAVAVVALSATLRTGTLKALYIAFSIAIGLPALLARDAENAGIVAGVAAVYIVAALVALRQFGEALARYDPVE